MHKKLNMKQSWYIKKTVNKKNLPYKTFQTQHGNGYRLKIFKYPKGMFLKFMTLLFLLYLVMILLKLF